MLREDRCCVIIFIDLQGRKKHIRAGRGALTEGPTLP